MMVATNWGVYEFGKRDMQFRDADDPRDMQIRARSAEHLNNLRERFPTLGENVYLGYGVADFQWRVYITAKELSELMYMVTGQIDYVQFKKDAVDNKLHGVLSAMWTTLLRAYPIGSSYGPPLEKIRDKNKKRKHWWEEV